MAQRFFLPSYIVASGDAVWLVDAARPAAAVLRPGASPHLVTWTSEVGRALDDYPGRIVAPDGLGIVVQDFSELSWLRHDGSLAQQDVHDLTLAAADPEFAWLVDRALVDVGDVDSPGPPVPPPLQPGRVVAIRPDGSRTETATPQPVQRVLLDGESVTLVLAERPTVTARGSGYRFGYPNSAVRLDRRTLLAGRFEEPEPTDAPRVHECGPGHQSSGWTWLETDPALVLRYGMHVGGLVWWAGTPIRSDRINRRVVIVGHDPTTAHERIRVDLGLGMVSAMSVIGDELWVAVARERFLYESRSQGTEVVAVSTKGESRTVFAANSIDISFTAPPLRRPSDEVIDSHLQDHLDGFGQLDRYWTDQSGNAGPLADGLADPVVNVIGVWPDARLVVRFRHSSRPDVLLRRTYRLFGEWGEPIDHGQATILLMEDLDTGYIAPASEAVDGILDT